MHHKIDWDNPPTGWVRCPYADAYEYYPLGQAFTREFIKACGGFDAALREHCRANRIPQCKYSTHPDLDDEIF